jgi:formylmethanofuran dehydrogenase subunit E
MEDFMNSFSIDRMHPRRIPQQLLLDGNMERLLELAGMLHGHYCPGVALGVKAVEAAFGRLGITDNTGMEEIMAVIEGNSCVADGIQFASGCTLGNNALVYKDLGRTAATFYRRGGERAVRVSVRKFEASGGTEEEKKEGDALFEKAVKRREKLSDAESARMKELWIKRSFETAAMPVEELFTISDVPVPRLPFAPIVDSQVCSICGESVMESRAVFRNGQAVCIACAGEEYRMVIGKGIATTKASDA